MNDLYEAIQKLEKDIDATGDLATTPVNRNARLSEIPFETEVLHLYRSLSGISPETDHKVFFFTGVTEGSGTSSIVRSLARAAAGRFGRRVAILDVDTLHPSQHRQPGVNPVHAFGEFVIFETTQPDLYVISPSLSSKEANALVVTKGMEASLDKLRQRFDLVLIDAPAASVQSDTIAFSRQANGVVLVVEAESTRWPSAKIIVDRISAMGGEIVGTVLNKRKFHIPDFIYKKL